MDAIDDLLSNLLEKPANEWSTALEDLCSTHTTSAAEIRRRFAVLQRMGVANTASDDLQATIPERFGPYRLLRRLGGGGMGIVYLARHDQLGRTVALKLIRPERLYFENARERFQREIEAVARLEHPGCVQILQVGEAQGIPYFAMEHIDGVSFETLVQRLVGRSPAKLTGQDLAKVLRHSSTRSVETAASEVFSGPWARCCLRLVLAAAEALTHAHGRGVVHRDLKPSNLMLTPEGRVVVIDFGLAVAEGVSRMTRSGAFLGSLPYMAPEQVRGDHQAIDARTDVYALGVCLYELLALISPFESASSETTRERILTGLVTPLRNHNTAVGTDVTVICARAMDPDPRRRYPSMADFAADLAAVLEHRAITARPATLLQRGARWARRRPAIATALVLGALVVLLGPLLFTLGLATQRDRALAAEQLARRREYAANIAAANAALLAGNGGEARRRLDSCAIELRGFEWRHLDLALDGSLLTVAAHKGAVNAVAISKDLRWLASGSAKGELALFDADTGARAHLWPGDQPIAQLEFDPTGSELFAVDRTGRVRVFEVASGRLLRELPPGEATATTSLAVGASVILRNNYAGRFERFDAKTMQRLTTVALAAGHEWPDGLTMNNGTLLAARSSVGSFSLWNLSTGQHVAIGANSRQPDCLATTPDLKTIAGADAWSVFWWDHTSGRSGSLDPGETNAIDVALTPSGRHLAAACASGEIQVFELGDGRLVRRLFGHEGSVTAITAASERELIVTGGQDGSVRVWSLLAAPESAELRGPGEGSCLAIANDGRVFLGTRAGAVQQVDAGRGDLAWATSFVHWVNAMTLTNDQEVIVANYYNHLRCLDARTGAELAKWEDGAQKDYGTRMVPGGGPRDVYMIDLGGNLGRIDAARHKLTAHHAVHRGYGYGLAFDAKTRTVLSVGQDGRLVESDGETLAPLRTLVEIQGQIVQLALRGDVLITSERHRGGSDLLCRRDRATGTVLTQTAAELCLAITWLGEDRLVTGSIDGRLVLRDPLELTPILESRLSAREILDIGVDPNGQWLAVQITSSDPMLLFAARDDAYRGAHAGRALVVAGRELAMRQRDDTPTRESIRRRLDQITISDELRDKAIGFLPPTILWWALVEGITLGLSTDAAQTRREFLMTLRQDLRDAMAAIGDNAHIPAARIALGLISIRLQDAAAAREAIAPVLAACERPDADNFFLCAFVHAMSSLSLGEREVAVTLAARMRANLDVVNDPEIAHRRSLLREVEDALAR